MGRGDLPVRPKPAIQTDTSLALGKGEKRDLHEVGGHFLVKRSQCIGDQGEGEIRRLGFMSINDGVETVAS